MGKRKIVIEKIENQPQKMMVTFSKRRKGLFKKASELSSMSDAQIAMVVFSPAGRPYLFGDVDTLIDDFLAGPAGRPVAGEDEPVSPARLEGPKNQERQFFVESVGMEGLEQMRRLERELGRLKESVIAHAREMRKEDDEEWRQFVNGIWGNPGL